MGDGLMRCSLLIVGLAVAMPAAALATPVPSHPGVTAIFALRDGTNAVTHGSCRVAVDRTCTILLQHDELFKSVMGAAGCATATDTACPWRYDAPPAGTHDAAVVIVPNYPKLATNVMIFTDKRTYDVALSSDGKSDQVIGFADLTKKVVASNRPIWDTPTPAQQCQIPPPQPSVAQMDELVAVAQQNQPRWTAWDPDYRVQGNSDFRPLWVATDGERTILAMPIAMAMAPSVYVKVDSKLVPVTPDVQGRLWLIDGVQQDVYLKLDSATVEVHRGR